MGAYKSKKLEKSLCEGEETDICSICLFELRNLDTIKPLICNHTFHKKCIDKWSTTKKECPLCKCKYKNSSSKEIMPKVERINSSKNQEKIEVVDGNIIGSYMPVW